MSQKNFLPAFATTLGAVLVLSLGCEAPSNKYAPPPPEDVSFIQPLVRDVVGYVEQTGETESVGQAEVRSRVKGIIKSIDFLPGQVVEVDSPLYHIEDDTYRVAETAATAEVNAAKAAILVAEANVAVGNAAVAEASSEFERQRQLMVQQATSQAEFDRAKANLDSANAGVRAAQASVTAAQATLEQAQAKLAQTQLDLGYTVIRSPIRGRVTVSSVEVGNLIDVGTSLCSVIDANTLYVNFSISDREAVELADTLPGSELESRGPDLWQKTPVFIGRESDIGYPFVGRMDYVAQEGVNTATASLSLRALVAQSENKLIPGLFVRIRVPVGITRGALMIPESLVQRNQLGTFCLTIGDDNDVRQTKITLGRRDSGWIVVRQGLTSDSRVVYDSFKTSFPEGINPTKYEPTAEELPAPLDSETLQWLQSLEKSVAVPEVGKTPSPTAVAAEPAETE